MKLLIYVEYFMVNTEKRKKKSSVKQSNTAYDYVQIKNKLHREC